MRGPMAACVPCARFDVEYGPSGLNRSFRPCTTETVDERVATDGIRAATPQLKGENRVVAKWLARVASTLAGTGRANAGPPEKHRLLYLLNRRPGGRQMTVHPVLVYLRKDGRYGAMKRLSLAVRISWTCMKCMWRATISTTSWITAFG